MRHVVLLALTLAAAGCVSTDTFRKKEEEARKAQQSYEDEAQRSAVLKEKLSQKEAELRASQEQSAALQRQIEELSTSKQKLEAKKAELEKRSSEYEQLATALRGEIDSGRVELMELRGKTTVKMKDKILFASGSARLGADGRAALKKVVEALTGMQGKAVRVEGHTDNVPTGGTGGFATNWELSTARALAVVRFFQEGGMDATRLSAAGFGEFQPVAANDTPEGRSLNRRIEIVLVPFEGAVPAPPAAAPAATPATKT
jgi:chemotaxis protein MotB